MKDVLHAEGVAADFESLRDNEQVPLDYIHRRADDADIYFVANRDPRAAYRECTFRVRDKGPEMWEPYSGDIRRALLYKQTEDGRVTVPVFFEPYGSTIVVFRSALSRHAVALAKDGRPIFPRAEGGAAPNPVEVFAGGKNDLLLASTRCARQVRSHGRPGPYALGHRCRTQNASHRRAVDRAIRQRLGAPEETTFEKLASWTENGNANIKYFSGIATYVKEIDIAPEMLAAGHRLELDLGDVQEMAEVLVNGKSLGAFWKPPFTIDVGSVAKVGKNTLEIRVANHWRNRLIGDAQLPAGERRTKTNVVKYESGTHDLLPSGLMGPVVLRSYAIYRQALE